MRALLTIGYQGTEIDRFVESLKRMDIELLLDIRELPLSRKKGFSKTALSQGLSDNSIRYHHLRALGDPKPGRAAVRRGDWKAFEQIYYSHLETEPAQLALKEAIDLSNQYRTCLLCFERDAEGCHRKIVANTMAMASEFMIEHIQVS